VSRGEYNTAYLEHYNTARPHRGINLDVLGGLIH
jgi:hypothetical protein